MAPTYRNDSTVNTYRVTNTSGEVVDVRPGESVTTYDIGLTGLTLISDAPYYNPTLSWDIITVAAAGSGESSSINPELVKEIEVYSRNVSSGEALVHLNAVANGVAARIQPGRSVIFEADTVNRKVNKVVVSSTLGSIVEIVARKETS